MSSTRTTITATLPLAFALMLTLPALAQESPQRPTADAVGAKAAEDATDDGVYIRLGLGFGSLFSGEVDRHLGNSTQRSKAQYGIGYGVGLGVGYQLDRSWGFELELAYRLTPIEQISERGSGATIGSGGDYATLAVLVNLIYKLDVDWPLRPFFGVGFGYMGEVHLDIKRRNDSRLAYSGTALAYQVILGLEWESPVSGLYLTGETRMFGAVGDHLESEKPSDTAEVTAPYHGFEFRTGVGFRF